MAADCEMEIRPGVICEVTTLGRCSRCGRAFCLTHQARKADGFGGTIPYVDRCSVCEQEVEGAMAEGQRREAARVRRVAKENAASLADLTTALANSDRTPFVARRAFVGSRPNHANPFRAFFGKESVMQFSPLPPAAAIGQLRWEFPPVPRGESNQILTMASGITRSGEVVVMNSGPLGEERVPNPIHLVSDEAEVLQHVRVLAERLGLI